MDPSKRVCLKNIPPECTKREIAEFVRSRTGTHPHSIDLGLDKEGHIRRYAHFSVEGAKNVISLLSGTVWRGSEVTALLARPHYTYQLAEARRKRERLEAEAREQLEAACNERIARWMEKTGGELQKGNAPKSFYATRQRYAEIAAQIGKRLREEHRKKHPVAVPRWGRGKALNAARGDKDVVIMGAGTPVEHEAKTKATKVAGPRQSAEPSKEERKLSALQAKLAALRAKIK